MLVFSLKKFRKEFDMDIENLMRLLAGVSESAVDSFSYREKDFSIKMSKSKILSDPGTFKKETRPGFSGKETLKIEAESRSSGKAVKSPLVGVFYGAPAEGADPFVKLGDSVKKGQTLAIVEAMKLMNEIEAKFDGVIKEICVKNGEPVEYGQNLFIIETEEN